MNEDSKLSDDGVKVPTLFTRVLIRLAFVLVMLAFFPALPSDASAQVASKPETMLGQGWQWLGNNKDQLSALSALFGGGSLVFAEPNPDPLSRCSYRTTPLCMFPE
jgi:hypothetical protein